MLKGGLRCLRGENVLVNVSQNHRYYSGDLKSSSCINEQEQALFPPLVQTLTIPCCLRRSDKTQAEE